MAPPMDSIDVPTEAMNGVASVSKNKSKSCSLYSVSPAHEEKKEEDDDVLLLRPPQPPKAAPGPRPTITKQPSVWETGLARKASPYLADSWISLSLTLDGRDKITKLLQYFFRLAAFILQEGAGAKRSKLLSSNLASSRKAFRLGRSMVELQKLRKMGIFCILMQAIGLRSTKANTTRTGINASSTFSAIATKLGKAGKILGTCGFWAADNLSFLTTAGFFDDLSKTNDMNTSNVETMNVRQDRKRKLLLLANRSYFLGSISGLYVTLKAYMEFREVTVAQRRLDAATTKDERIAAEEYIKGVKEKQFNLLLALIKSCCDVMVFANNTGIDLFKYYTGRKLHEGVHCLGGMISAATILYNNYPNNSA